MILPDARARSSPLWVDVPVVSGTEITANLTVPADAATGKWDVGVTPPEGGTTVKSGTLSIVSKVNKNAIPTRTYPTRTFPTRAPGESLAPPSAMGVSLNPVQTTGVQRQAF